MLWVALKSLWPFCDKAVISIINSQLKVLARAVHLFSDSFNADTLPCVSRICATQCARNLKKTHFKCDQK